MHYVDIKDYISNSDVPPLIQFEEVRKFSYYSKFDYEEWCYRYYVDLVLSTFDDKYTILVQLKNIVGRCQFNSGIQVIGFAIEKIKNRGYESKQYHVFDFEENSINAYCDEIGIQLVNLEEFIL